MLYREDMASPRNIFIRFMSLVLCLSHCSARKPILDDPYLKDTKYDDASVISSSASYRPYCDCPSCGTPIYGPNCPHNCPSCATPVSCPNYGSFLSKLFPRPRCKKSFEAVSGPYGHCPSCGTPIYCGNSPHTCPSCGTPVPCPSYPGKPSPGCEAIQGCPCSPQLPSPRCEPIVAPSYPSPINTHCGGCPSCPHCLTRPTNTGSGGDVQGNATTTEDGPTDDVQEETPCTSEPIHKIIEPIADIPAPAPATSFNADDSELHN